MNNFGALKVSVRAPGWVAAPTTNVPAGLALWGAGQGRTGQGRAGQGRAGQGRAGQGRAGQGRAGQGRAGRDDITRLRVPDGLRYVKLCGTDVGVKFCCKCFCLTENGCAGCEPVELTGLPCSAERRSHPKRSNLWSPVGGVGETRSSPGTGSYRLSPVPHSATVCLRADRSGMLLHSGQHVRPDAKLVRQSASRMQDWMACQVATARWRLSLRLDLKVPHVSSHRAAVSKR